MSIATRHVEVLGSRVSLISVDEPCFSWRSGLGGGRGGAGRWW